MKEGAKAPSTKSHREIIAELTKSRTDAFMRLEDYRTALETFGTHVDGCNMATPNRFCTCGWSRTRERLGIRVHHKDQM